MMYTIDASCDVPTRADSVERKGHSEAELAGTCAEMRRDRSRSIIARGRETIGPVYLAAIDVSPNGGRLHRDRECPSGFGDVSPHCNRRSKLDQ